MSSIFKAAALAAVLSCSTFMTTAANAAEITVGAATVDVGTLDPHFANSTSDRTLVSWIFGGLVRFAPGTNDPATIEGDLAESWTASDDNLVWTFKLRQGVQWQHGYGEVTADDVVFSLQKSADPARSAVAGDYGAFESVKALDPYTVEVTLSEPIPSLLGVLANFGGGFLVSQKAVEERGEGFSRNPVGFGPFKVESIEPGVALTLTAHDDYFRGKPNIDKVLYRFLNAIAARDLAFTSGETDVTTGAMDQRWVQRMRNSPNTVVDIFYPAELAILHLNVKQEPLTDIRVRQAIAHAVNAEQIAQFRGAEFTHAAKSVIPSDNLGLNPEPGVLPHNIARAKELLAEAGYPDGLSIKMISSQLPNYATMDPVIQAQLKEAGINLDLQPVEHATWHQMIRQDLSPMVEYSAARFPVADTYLTQFYHSNSAIGAPGQSTNFSHCDVADQQIEAARVEVDRDRQIELWQEAQKLIVEHVCAIPLVETQQVWAHNDKLDWGFELKGALGLGPLLTEQATLRE